MVRSERRLPGPPSVRLLRVGTPQPQGVHYRPLPRRVSKLAPTHRPQQRGAIHALPPSGGPCIACRTPPPSTPGTPISTVPIASTPSPRFPTSLDGTPARGWVHNRDSGPDWSSAWGVAFLCGSVDGEVGGGGGAVGRASGAHPARWLPREASQGKGRGFVRPSKGVIQKKKVGTEGRGGGER